MVEPNIYIGCKGVCMKSLKTLAMILALLMALPALAATQSDAGAGVRYGDAVAAKFGRGFANVTTGWLELPKYVIKVSKQRNLLYGVTLGLFNGIIHGVGRTVVGALQLGTFLVPTPEVIHPRFVWSPFSQNTRYAIGKEGKP
ncbi:MAG: exosortase system-associated protein, TIGR04073 family [Mariprofundales bacterium]|nr:exosortase system-associated protein, TIGR04073 family [Mariprofundales bacterium]